MTEYEHEGGVGVQRLEIPGLQQVLRGFLDPERRIEITPVGEPRLVDPGTLQMFLAPSEVVFGEMASWVEREPARAPLILHRRDHVMEVVPLVLGHARTDERGHRRVTSQQLCEGGGS